MSLPSEKADQPRGVFVQRQGMNVYTVMLILSLLAITIGCIFLSMEMAAYDWDYKATDVPPAAMLDLEILRSSVGLA